MLVFDRLSKTRADGTLALSAVTATVAAGEILALVGGSGCGKTMLLELVAGLDRPSEGRVLLDGQPIAGPRADVCIISREPRLFPWLDVAEHVAFGLPHRSAFEREGLVANALVRVGLAGCEKRRPHELSDGQRQRLAIARALVTRPKLLLLDEPFSTLDATTRASLHGHLMALWEESRPTMVMATRDVEDAATLADRILVMQPKPGRIFAELGNPSTRPRDRRSPGFEAIKREVLGALDRALREEQPHRYRAAEAAGM